MSPVVFIAVACHNRKRVAELCLPTLRESVPSNAVLALYDDGSTEYTAEWLRHFCPSENHLAVLAGKEGAIGIQAQRRMHLRHFLQSQAPFTHMYMTDHDCIHAPNWYDQAMRLQAAAGGLPLCLYDTESHRRIAGNTLEDDPESEIIYRKVAPGVSYFLTRKHVEAIHPFLPGLDHFDWSIPAILGSRFAVSRVGYIDHIGWGGCRHPENEGPDGGDRVLNPVLSLVAKRAEIVAALNAPAT